MGSRSFFSVVAIALVVSISLVLLLEKSEEEAPPSWSSSDIPQIDVAPVEIRIFLNRANVPFDRISAAALPPGRTKARVLINLPGCAHATLTDNIPKSVAVLAGSERNEQGKWARLEACSSNDGEALERVIRNEFEALLDVVETTPWLDESHVVIRGYGEAAPIVASYAGPSAGRIIWGEPCLVAWGELALETDLTVLLVDPASGITRDRTTSPAFTCEAKPRPVFSGRAVDVSIAKGRITPATHPVMLAEAEERALSVALDARRKN